MPRKIKDEDDEEVKPPVEESCPPPEDNSNNDSNDDEEKKPRRKRRRGDDGVSGEVEIKQPDTVDKDTFENRRAMAWVSLISILALTLLVIFKFQPEQIDSLGSLFGWVFGTLSTVILAYMGVTAYAYSSWLKKKK